MFIKFFDVGGEGKVKTDINQEDCILNFANYDRCTVGSISSLFDRWASSSPLGINSPQCKILNLRFTKAIDSAKTGERVNINDLRSTPEPLKGSAQKVWSKMDCNAEAYIGNKYELTPISDIIKNVEFDDFLSFIQNPPSSLSEFQKFRLAYKCCVKFGKIGDDFNQICRNVINFTAFTNCQKQLLPLDVNIDMKKISNELYRSSILSSDDIGRLGCDMYYPWSMYYKSVNEDKNINWDVLKNVLQSDYSKLIVLHFLVSDRNWVIVMYFTNAITLEETTQMKDWLVPAKFHFFQHGAHFEHKNWRGETLMERNNYLIEVKNKRLQIYDNEKQRTFIYMEEKFGETITSIDLNQFGVQRTDYRKLQKERCLNCEIFVQYPALETAPVLLQPKFFNELIDDVDKKEINLSTDEIQDFLLNDDEFPLDNNVQTETIDKRSIQENPVKVAEAILKQDVLSEEIAKENISVLYQALLGTPQVYCSRECYFYYFNLQLF